MKIKAKKGLALVLSLLMVISLLSVVIFNVTADPVSEPVWDKLDFEYAEGTTVTDDNTYVSMSGAAGKWAVTTLTTALPKIKIKPTLNADGDEAYLSITNRAIIDKGVVTLNSTYGLNLKFVRSGTALEVYVYNADSQWEKCATVGGYDFTTAHTFSWSRPNNYTNWRLTIDDTVYNTLSISNYIYALGNESTFTFFGVDKSFGFENVQICGGVGDSFTELTSAGKLSYSGDLTNGYTVTSTVTNTFATYNTAYDFDTTLISFKVKGWENATNGESFGFTISTNYGGSKSPTIAVGSWGYIAGNNSTTDTPTGDTITFAIRKSSTHYQLCAFGVNEGWLANVPLAQFDPNKEHLMGYIYTDGKYKLYFDGATYSNDATIKLDKYVTNLIGKKAYYSFHPTANLGFENLKFVDMSQGEGIVPHSTNFSSGQDADGTYWINRTGAAYPEQTVGFMGAIDVASQGIQINFSDQPEWATIIFNNSPTADNTIYIKPTDDTIDNLRFLIRNTSGANEAAISIYSNNLPDVRYGTISNWDWNATHTFNLSRDADGVWNLYIDGKLPKFFTAAEGTTGKPSYQAVQDEMGAVLEKLATNGAYLHLGARGAAGKISKIKVINFLKSNGTIVESKTNAGLNVTDTVNNGRVAYLNDISLQTEYISFKQNVYGTYSQICFSSTFLPYADFVQDKETQISNKTVNLNLYKQGSNLVVKCAYYGDGTTLTEETIGTINGFDFNAAHTYGFNKNNSNDWVIAIDNNLHNFQYSKSLKDYLNATVEATINSNIYVQLSTSGGKLGFSEIKTTDIPNIPHERTNFYYTVNEYKSGGNSAIGYFISSTKSNKFVGFKDSLDFKTQSIYAKINIGVGKTAFLGFSNDYKFISGYPNSAQEITYNAIGLSFKKVGANTALVSAYYGEDEHVIGEIQLDWSVAHWYGFTKINTKDGEQWRLLIDGLDLFDLSNTAFGVFQDLGEKINNFANSGKTYAIFGSQDATINIANVKVYANEDVVSPVLMPFRWDTGVECSGQEIGGYSIIGEVNDAVTSFKNAIDINTQSIRLLANVSGGAKVHLGFVNFYDKISYEPVKDDEDKYSIISLFLNKTGEKELTITAYFNGAEHTLGKVAEYDWAFAHVFGFTKVEDEWTLVIDGVALADKGEDYVSIMEHITPFIKSYASSEKVYTQFSIIGGKQEFSRIRVIENKDITAPEESPFILPDATMVYDGNSKQGYTLSGTSSNKVALYKPTYNFNTQSVFTTIGVPNQKWGVLIFSTKNDKPYHSCSNYKNYEEENNSVFLMLRNATVSGYSRLYLSALCYIKEDDFNGSPVEGVREVQIGYVNDFNWNAAHAISFAKTGDKWAVLVDGRHLDVSLNNSTLAFKWISPLLDNLSEIGDINVQIGIYDALPNFQRFRIVDNKDVEELVIKEMEEFAEPDTDIGDWDDTWDLEKGDNDDDEDWEFTFGQEDEEDFFDFEEEEEIQEELPEPEITEEEDDDKGTVYKKVTYVTKKTPGLTTLQIILIIAGGVLAAGAVITVVIIILVKRKKNKAN